MSDIVLSVPVDAGGVDPLLASLEKINENLNQINASSKGSFELMAKSLDKTNKKLKETDKTFGEIFKKIKLSGLMKMGAGVIGGAAGLVGLSTGALLFGALKNAAGTISTRYAGAGLGMSPAEMKALQTSSKLMTGKEETLVNAMTNLNNTLTSGEGQGALANLGLNAEQLKTMSPEKALEAVFESVKGKGTGIGSEYLRRAFMEITGLSGQDYNVAEKKGASFGKDYREFLVKYAAIDFDALARGAESIIKFQTQLDIVSDKIGAKLADPLARILDKLTPSLDKFADEIAKILDSITKEDIDKFTTNLIKVMTAIGKVAGWIVETTTSENPGATSFEKREEARKKGDVLGYIGYDLQGGAEQFIGETGQWLWNGIFDPEQNIKNLDKKRAAAAAEPEALDYIFGAGTRAKMDKWIKDNLSVSAHAGGETKYVTGNYGSPIKVEVTVKDPAGKVLSSSVATQGSPKPAPATRGGRNIQ